MAGGTGGFCIPHSVRETPGKGRGVFAEASIATGEIVWRHARGLFAVYDEASFKRLLARLSRREAVYELTHVYGLPEFPGYLVRAFDDSELFNHSRRPNTAMNNVVAGNLIPFVTAADNARAVEEALLDDRFAMVAVRNVSAGEELTQDYRAGMEDPPYFTALCEQYGVSWAWM